MSAACAQVFMCQFVKHVASSFDAVYPRFSQQNMPMIRWQMGAIAFLCLVVIRACTEAAVSWQCTSWPVAEWTDQKISYMHCITWNRGNAQLMVPLAGECAR